MLAPVMLVLLLAYGYPIINSLIMAFQNYKLTQPDKIYFNGVDNFAKLFSDSDLWMIFRNTLIYVCSCVLAQFTFGFILALALKKPFKGRGIYQAIVFLPWAFSAFSIGLIFRWSFNGEYGIVNYLLTNLHLTDSKLAFLGTPGLSLLVVIIAMIWMGIPFFAIMLLAALQSIPEDLYEAAAIDGCRGIQQFFYIILPFVKPTIITTVLLRTIWIFNSFDLIVMLTNGGPANKSQTLLSYMYNKAFSGYDFGFASAIGVLSMTVLSIFAILFMKTTNYTKAGEF
ncbi:MAG: sugar ABC transporter permease [Lachnospiraceae bacterium]|nr:sugar ABC transporter permease [Lachnospiraceae bacterium]